MIKHVTKVVLFVVILEMTIFNFRHWESKFFPEVNQPLIEVAEGIEKLDDTTYKVIDTNKAFINLIDIQGQFKNLYLPIIPKTGITTNITIFSNDAANNNGLNLGDATVVASVPQSSYLRLHLNGVSNYIRVKINQENNFLFSMDLPQINAGVPVYFSWMRMICIFIIVLLISIFKPGSWIYKEKLRLDSKWKKGGLVAFVCLQLIIIWIIGQLIVPNKSIQNLVDSGQWPAHGQYNELANAFIEGRTYLDRQPPEALKLVKNPYDPTLRAEVLSAHNETYDIDYAYYADHYFSYFGPIPALVFFVPYKLITGHDCATWNVVTLCTMLFCISSFYMLYVFGICYFKNVSYGMYLLMSAFFFWASGTTYLVYTGNVYSLPIICSLLFGTTGITCWLLAKSEKLQKKFLVLGSFFIALIIGSRPQLALILFLAFPIFGKQIIQTREFFSKKGFVNTVCVMLPFLCIGCAMMCYNYVRFDSPFDFGATYNLTGNDMTHRGFELDRIPLGIFCYLIQPLNIIPQYPFMQTVNITNDYLGYTSAEPLFGGFFMMNSLALCSLFVVVCKKKLKESMTYGISMGCMIMAIVIILLDIQMSGLTQRYMSDFGWLLLLPAILVVFSLENILQSYKVFVNAFYGAVFLFVGVSITLNLWSLLIIGRYFSLIYTRPTLFYLIKALI